MKTFKTLGVASLALAALVGFGCEKREVRTTETRTETTATPAPAPTAATEPTAPADRVPGTLDERQPVSGREGTAMPSDTTAPATTTTTTTTTTSDIYYVTTDGKRLMLHNSALLTDVQRKLSDEGLYHGSMDGKTSPEMMTAIRDYQAKKNLEQTGAIDRSTAESLGLAWDRFEAGAAGIGSEIKHGATETMKDLKAGAKDVGREIKEGADKAGTKIEEGADKAKEELAPEKRY